MLRGREIRPREQEAHLQFKEETCPLIERRKDQREGEIKRIFGKKKKALHSARVIRR